MFEVSHPWSFLDYFRVPHDVTGPPQASGRGPWPSFLGRMRRSGDEGSSRALLWPRAGVSGELGAGCVPGRHRLGTSWLVGNVVTDASAAEWLPRAGDGWRPVHALERADGARVASVWQDVDGNVFLPFDMGEVMQNLWSEGYLDVQGRRAANTARRALLRGYYAVKPLLPRRTQLALRRRFSRIQSRAAFPRWPIEDSLHDLSGWVLTVLAEVSGEPVPWLAAWPDGFSWALVLTHDVDTAAGQRDLHLLRDPERRWGYRSSWNFVPERYVVDEALLAGLREEGCEVGVHGLRHDGRDLGSRRSFEERLPLMREYAERWGAVGFRSPATQRVWEWMPELGFDYDCSYTDTDPYEPQPGGCCSYLPYFNQGQVELPITLPQDHTLFVILQHADGAMWLDKARHLRDRGGMALVLAHPDYASDPRLAGAWSSLLEEFCDDGTAWQALPNEVADWWRCRASSSLRRDDGGWHVEGPAAGRGAVRFTMPRDWSATLGAAA